MFKESYNGIPMKIEEQGLAVYCFPEEYRVEERYTAYVDDENIYKLKIYQIGVAKAVGTSVLLSDMTAFGGASPEVLNWVVTVWLQAMNDVGIKHIAMVMPPDMFGAFTLEQALGPLVSLFNAEKFTAYDEAVKWCNSQL